MIQRLSLRSQHIMVNFLEGHKKIAEYFLHLMPLFIISMMVSFHEQTLLSTHVGRKTLFDLFIIVALISPWLAQACCFPIYVEIGKELYSNGNESLSKVHSFMLKKFIWVPILSSLLISSFFYFSLREDILFSISIFFLLLLQIFFAQFMVLPLIQRNFKLWIIGWFFYMFSFFTCMPLWFFPPLAGTLAIFFLTKPWKNPFKFKVSFADFLVNFAVGLMMGIILWIDKIQLFMTRKELNTSSYIFISLLPSLLTLNYFYIFKLERIRESFKKSIDSISKEKISKYLQQRDLTFKLVLHTFSELFIFHFFCSMVSILFSIMILKLDFKIILLGHCFSFLMTSITIFFNNLLLLRAFKTFFQIVFLITFTVLTLLSQKHDSPNYLPSLLASLFIT